MLKKPLRLAHSDRPQDDTVSLADADGEPVADMVLHDYDVARAKQIALAVNAFDDLLAACERAEDVIAFALKCQTNTLCEGCDVEFTDVLIDLKAAVTKAKPQPASVPDVSCEELR